MISKRKKRVRMAVQGFIVFTMVLSNLIFYNPVALANTEADPGLNSLAVSPTNTTRGQAVTLTAAGDRQSEAGVEDGDTRFFPAEWFVTGKRFEPGYSGYFGLNEATQSYTSTFSPATAGSFEITAVFTKQRYNDQIWNYDGSESTSATLIVTASSYPANEANNIFSLPGSDPIILTMDEPFTVTATGDKQDAESGEGAGAERYIPKSWSSSDYRGGTFIWKDETNSYTSTYTPAAIGNIDFTVMYGLEIWDGSVWQETGVTDQKMKTIQVTREPVEADAANNTVSTGISGVIPTNTSIKVNLSGDNQYLDDRNAMSGDTRYIPIDVSISGGGGSCSMGQSLGVLFGTCTPSRAGTFSLEVTFRKERFNGTDWIPLGAGDNDTKTLTIFVSGPPTTVNVGSNTVTLNSNTIFEGGSVTVTAIGNRQSATGVSDKDERYVPTRWKLLRKDPEQEVPIFQYTSFAEPDNYSAVITPPGAGQYVVEVEFDKQRYDLLKGTWGQPYGPENDSARATLNVVQPANPDNNQVSATPSKVTSGGSFTLTAKGDRQSETGGFVGNERYLPVTWVSTDGESGSFILNGTAYTSYYKPSQAGDHTVTVTFNKQVWNGTTWENEGEPDTKEIKPLKAEVATANADNNSISANPESVTSGEVVTVTISGDRQTATGVFEGDERYVPVSWESTDGKSGDLDASSGSFQYTPSTRGTHTITATFQKQQWNSDEGEWANVDGGTDTKTTTVWVIAAASDSANTISINPDQVTSGGTVTVTAAGDRQSEEGLTAGDERYIPVSWTSTDGKLGSFSNNGTEYTSDYKPAAAGTQTVTVTFQKQIWDATSGDWVDVNGATDTKTETVEAEAAKADAANNSVSADPESVMSGGAVTVTISGDRQSAVGLFEGDERYVPISWESTDDESGLLDPDDETFEYTPAAVGTRTVTVTFQKQKWNAASGEWASVPGEQDTKTTTVEAEVATVDAAHNSISADPASITSGGTVTVTISGDRQGATGLFEGDERYVPTGWTSTDGQSDSLDTSDGSFEYSSSTKGTHTVTVTFQKQRWSSGAGEWANVNGETDTKSATVSVITPASDSGNSVSINPDQVTSGGTVTVTAAGDRQSEEGLTSGDERYIPVSWTSTDGKSGSFSNNGTEYTSDYKPAAVGTQTVTVTFQKQTWDATSGDWVDINSATDTKTETVEAEAAKADAANNSVSADPDSVTSGGTVTMTVSGDRQSAVGLFTGDERFIPTSWSSTDGETGSLSPSDATFEYTPSKSGTHTVTVTFQKQTWNAASNTWNDNGGTTSAFTTVEATAATANAGNNVVYSEPGSVTSGGTIMLFAAGDRQSATGLFEGDERYIPVNWESTDDQSGSFTYSGTDYTSDYMPSAVGNHTVSVIFKKQKWDSVLGWEDTDDTDVKTTIASLLVIADPDNNSAGASTASVTTGGTVTLTATGDRQSEDGVAIGDERFVPTSWTSTEAGQSGVFTENNGTYTSVYKPSRAGHYLVTITFRKQIWDGSAWADDLTTETRTVNVSVSEPDEPSGQPDPGPSANGFGTATTGVDVLVNGKVENAGTATTTQLNDKTVTTIAVDQNKLEAKLAAEGQHAIVTIPIKMTSNIVVGELNGRMIRNMEEKQAVLEIRTDRATYTVPAEQMNMNAISAQIGKAVPLQDIKVQIEIAEPMEAIVRITKDLENQGKFVVVAPPFHFEVRATYGNTTIEVTKFNIYVERTIAIPEGVDPNKITTGVVVDPDGTVRHVPTKVTVIDGVYYAVINSLTNSTYAVVWHPLTFEDVAKHWAKDAVNDMGSRMVVEGTGNGMYSPDRDITRAEFAAILVRGLGLKLGTGTTAFSDVKATDWYNGAIHTAHEYGLIDGFTDGTFRPNDKITREQAMLILSKAMTLTGLKDKLSAKSAEATLGTFVDAASVAAWAQGGVADSLQSGIVMGRGQDTLAPKAHMTRAEVAQVIRLLLRKSELI